MKDKEEISLPENIKEEIRKNVADLKDILKDDSEYAKKLMEYICNIDHYLASDIACDVYEHYSEIVKKCQGEYKPFPVEIQRLYKIVSFLAHLATGYQKMIFDFVGEVNDDNYDIINNKIKTLAKLCINQIENQFDPNIKYNYDIDCELLREYENDLRELNGENALDNSEI